jgi:hypothetical protein
MKLQVIFFRINVLEVKVILTCLFMWGQFNFTTKELCFRPSGSTPRSNFTSIKIMILWTSLLAYVLIQSYGVTLMSHITTVTSWRPTFNNLEGLLQSKYSLAVVTGSDIHSALKVSNSV